MRGSGVDTRASLFIRAILLGESMYSKEQVDGIVKDAIHQAMESDRELHLQVITELFEDIIEGIHDFGTDNPEMASASLASAGMLKGVRDRVIDPLSSIKGKVCTSEEEFKFYQSMMTEPDDASKEG